MPKRPNVFEAGFSQPNCCSPPAPANRSMQPRAAVANSRDVSAAGEALGGGAMTPVTWPPAPPTSSKRLKGTRSLDAPQSASDQFQATDSAASRTPRSVWMPVSPNQLATEPRLSPGPGKPAA